jgi:hypothetical protein
MAMTKGMSDACPLCRGNVNDRSDAGVADDVAQAIIRSELTGTTYCWGAGWNVPGSGAGKADCCWAGGGAACWV